MRGRNTPTNPVVGRRLSFYRKRFSIFLIFFGFLLGPALERPCGKQDYNCTARWLGLLLSFLLELFVRGLKAFLRRVDSFFPKVPTVPLRSVFSVQRQSLDSLQCLFYEDYRRHSTFEKQKFRVSSKPSIKMPYLNMYFCKTHIVFKSSRPFIHII